MRISETAVEVFLRKTKKRGAMILDIMGRHQPFQEAMEDPRFQEIVKDPVIRMDELSRKILDDTATPAEKAKFTAYKEILADWAERKSKYDRGVAEILKHNTQPKAG